MHAAPGLCMQHEEWRQARVVVPALPVQQRPEAVPLLMLLVAHARRQGCAVPSMIGDRKRLPGPAPLLRNQGLRIA